MSDLQSTIASTRVSPLYAANSKLGLTALGALECCCAFRRFPRRYSQSALTTHLKPELRAKYRPNFPRISPLTFLRYLAMIGIE